MGILIDNARAIERLEDRVSSLESRVAELDARLALAEMSAWKKFTGWIRSLWS